jgi:hypothetical protein
VDLWLRPLRSWMIPSRQKSDLNSAVQRLPLRRAILWRGHTGAGRQCLFLSGQRLYLQIRALRREQPAITLGARFNESPESCATVQGGSWFSEKWSARRGLRPAGLCRPSLASPFKKGPGGIAKNLQARPAQTAAAVEFFNFYTFLGNIILAPGIPL